jgi:thiosulfate/3-mercaptopyruvate sulfurtransferase
MMRLIALFTLGGLFLGSPISMSPSESRPRKDFFCPECWKFLSEPGDLDHDGRCSVSGKKPVEVDVVTVNWFWCRLHEAWHRRPCGKDSSAPSGSTALLVPAGSEAVTERAYCPEHRMISDFAVPGMKCPIDGKPLVGADTVERRWYWCRIEKAWLQRPSPSNGTMHCCSARSGMVLAYAWQLPFLGAISQGGRTGTGRMLVDAKWLAAHLDDAHLVILHVGFDPSEPWFSTRSTYTDGHILGARQVAWRDLAVTRKGIPNKVPPVEDLVLWVRSLGIDEGDRIVLYDTGDGIEAARAYLTLDYLGLGKNAALLDGQWERWKRLNLPSSRMPEEVEPSAFLPRLHPEIFVDLAAMKDLSWMAEQEGTRVSLLDARAADEFGGYRAGKGILRGGHIAGAKNLCWDQLLEPVAEEPIFRNEVELRALFEASGARPGRMVVVYCRTGTEASLVYVAAKLLGYEVRFYDGSYYEWSRQEEMPVQGSWAMR